MHNSREFLNIFFANNLLGPWWCKFGWVSTWPFHLNAWGNREIVFYHSTIPVEKQHISLRGGGAAAESDIGNGNGNGDDIKIRPQQRWWLRLSMDTNGRKQTIINVCSAKQRQSQTYLSMISPTGLYYILVEADSHLKLLIKNSLTAKSCYGGETP